MSKQTINIGASPNDGTGTPLRTSFDYTNQNFTELYTALGGGVGLPGATTQVIFNDGGTNLAGDAGLVYNKTTDTLTAGNATITGAATVGTTLGVTGASTLTGNVSVGTTLSAWGGNSKVVEVGVGSAVSSTGAGTTSSRFTHGCYFDNTNWKYQYTSVGATLYEVTGANSGSTHAWYVAPGGTAGNTVTAFTAPAMTLSYATGNLAFPTGKGIDFSAVTGGTGTATANVLNDYEEGTFTPTVEGTSTAGSATYSTQIARYTKVGRLVTFNLRVIYTGGTGTGNLRIAGLPFTTGFGANYAIYSENIALTAGYIAVSSSASSVTSIGIDQIPTGGGGALGVPYDAAGDIQISGSYTV